MGNNLVFGELFMESATINPSRREPVGYGTIEINGITVGPVRVWRNRDGSLDTPFKLTNIRLDETRREPSR